MGPVNAVTEVAQEAAFWVFLVAAVLGLLGGLLRLAAKANRIIDTTEQSAKKLSEVEGKLQDVDERLTEHQAYARFHWGPNGKSLPAHMRLRRLERAMNLDDID